MKFTKTVAQALANKVRQQLIDSRREFLNNFTISAEKEAELKALIAERFAVQARMKELDDTLYKIAPIDRSYNDTQDTWYKKFVRKIGEKSLRSLPSTETLVDDFLIESLEAENANELIDKITAKYSA